jgi:hypothetical protein
MTDGERPETWKAVPGFSKYEAGDLGHIRNVATGKPLAARAGTHGYLEVKPYGDDGKRHTRTVHSLVLLTFAGPCPDGQETLHGPGGPLDNRWPEAIRWGTKPDNHADQRAAGTATQPKAYRCINHERCGGMVARPGSRCLPCVTVVGVRAGAMLAAGMNLETVTERLGYSSPDWVHKLASQFGGYAHPVGQARAQGRRWPQRTMATLRYRWRGDGK